MHVKLRKYLLIALSYQIYAEFNKFYAFNVIELKI
jgi:hypothetical protein